MNNKTLLFGVGGFFLGILITIFVTNVFMTKETEQVSETPNVSMDHNIHNNIGMDDMVNILVDKNGDEFDSEFIIQMIDHHQGAIDMASLAAQRAKHKEIIDLSEAIITAQTEEIEMMKQWQREWGYQ